jgi:hypothetical protein
MSLLLSWRPNKKQGVTFPVKPEWVPDWVYTQAMTAKRNYNENWEFWVWEVSKEYNVSVAEAEDACIRGIQREINRYKLVYGNKIGNWFEEFLDMGDIFSKVNHPIYLPKLGDN